ncbi:MAG TPA: hypothetical protein IAB74_01915 [Candidatus Faecousia excrementigallinarum]|uniref:Uncharacterized protein n=1 Tax=Candidatus Faecousia excrementigallinarum TaxID=2840806 RepID=A0A9D1CLH8_9FIRM|nr:hypothetical protein [Candidatus Faecousia excrementigallinarum]
MHKKIIAMCLCLGLFLSGCQLAQPEETKTTQGETLESPVQMERLAGVYITLEPIVLEAGTDRIQAQKVSGEDSRYAFPGVEGLLLGSFWIPEGEGFWSMECSRGMSDASYKYDTLENGQVLTIEATLYLTKEAGPQVYYLNPVYQGAEGEVYLKPDDFGTSTSTEAIASENLTATTTIEQEEADVVNTTDITVNFIHVDLSQGLTVLEMDENHQILKTHTFTPGELPESLQPLAETAYILTEEQTASDTHRAIYQKEDTYFTALYLMDDMVCAQAQCSLEWQE